jgi:hypothetical protein
LIGYKPNLKGIGGKSFPLASWNKKSTFEKLKAWNFEKILLKWGEWNPFLTFH